MVTSETANSWHENRFNFQQQTTMTSRSVDMMTKIKRNSRAFAKIVGAAVIFLAAVSANTAQAQTRIKDIVDFEGVRENMLIGYGLVVGLNGTGDGLGSSIFTYESLVGMLERLGVNARDKNLSTKNVAAVMVTATLPPFSRQGTRIDVAISAIGDAKSLLGGQLLVTPLVGADAEVYAVAQGSIAVGGFSAAGNAASITSGVPTNGRISNGAIIEREIGFSMAKMDAVHISLRNPDFTTARRITKAINAYIGSGTSQVLDPATVRMIVPESYRGRAVALITDIEQLRITPDMAAKVVIDEQTGVIVMGENVRINTVAIAQGNLTIRITETPQVSQPQPFAEQGETVTVPRTQIDIDEDKDNKLTILAKSVTLQELVDGLNALGVGPRDMIAILQAIKAAGAMQAEIEVL